MTGYESKRAAAQDKLKQWDTPSEAFNEWWNGEYDDSTNPFTKHSLAYWAFAGWQAALAQPAQEPWPEEPVGHMAGGVQPPQRKPLTDEEISEIAINNPPMVHEFARAIEAVHGIKENT